EMKTVIDEIIEALSHRYDFKKIRIKDLRIGLRYTCVELSNGLCGLSFSYTNELFVENPPYTPGFITLLTLEDFFNQKRYTTTYAVIENAIVNALTNTKEVKGVEADIMDIVEINQNDRVCLVGAIGPIIKALEGKVQELLVFERDRHPHSKLYPDWAASEYLRKADVIFFTGASLINRTFDDLINYAKNAREVIVVGPSTPLYPDAFKKRGVTVIGGIVITDNELAKRIVSEGGGTHHLKPSFKKVTLRIK
ncbi:MAG: DUF364 domain-containing protein, partial [Candidatus Odinarchaeota archaeon]|nr:DUF364 domain-containing protein [Candidatus Odinarchaeota archaeon]